MPLEIAEAVQGDLNETRAIAEVNGAPFVILVLGGDVGVGKSVAAASWLLAPYLAGNGKGKPLWLSAARLARWDRYDESAMSRLLRVDRLVVDDLGVEYLDKNGAFLALVDELVDDRTANRRPTLITTNLDGDAFKTRYEARISDRIRSHGRFVSLAGASIRRRP